MARQIFGSYRKDDFADPESFLMQLGCILERYPDNIIREVTSPITGIQRRCKFPPSMAEVVEACDGEVARVARLARFSGYGAAQKLAPRPRAEHLANVFVSAKAPQYAAMVDRARRGTSREFRYESEGIWVPLGWLSENSVQKAQGFRRFTREELEAIYRRHEGAEEPDPDRKHDAERNGDVPTRMECLAADYEATPFD